VPAFTTDDGVRIVYRTWDGPAGLPPILLHHGFTGDAVRDWVEPGVVAALTAAGRTVVAPDARGHGDSDKPHDPAAYGEARMARDLAQLADALGLERFDLIGFSMGAVVALLAAAADERVRRLVVTGVGAGAAEVGGADRRVVPFEVMAEALLTDRPETITDPGALAFRTSAEERGTDRVAFAAQARAEHPDAIPFDRVTAPSLVLAGDADPFAQRPEVLAAAIPDARLEVLAGDHGSAITNPRFTEAVIGFLGV
jgi:pimeloyl-ACP methyl ester carboxylesterase